MPYVLWVFLGIDVISMNVEETKRPSSSIPKSYFLSFAAVAVLFLILIAICTRCVSYNALGKAEFPLVFVIQAIQQNDKVLLPVFSFLGIAIFVSSINGTVDGYARISFSLARAGYFPAALGNYIQKTKAPGTATFLLSCVVVVLAEFTDKNIMIMLAGISATLTYGFSLISYIRLINLDDQDAENSKIKKVSSYFTLALCLVILTAFLIYGTFELVIIIGVLALSTLAYYLIIRKYINHNAPEEVETNNAACDIKLTYL